jgi:competence protein ComEC
VARVLQKAWRVVDRTILLGLSLLAGGILSISPAPTAFAATVTLLLLRRHLTVAACAVTVAAVALGGLRAGSAVARLERDRAQVRAALGGPVRCFLEGEVDSSPILMHGAVNLAPAETPARAGEPPARPLVPGWDATLTHIECEGRIIGPKFRARLYGGPDDLARGDRVEVVAKLAPLQLFRNEDLGDPRPAAIRRGTLASGGTEDVRVVARASGPLAQIDRFRAHARRRIEATFVPEAAPMARALVLGESDLDPADNQAFRASGLAHLLAVSGTHLVLVVAGAVAACSFVLRRFASLSGRYDVGRLSSALGVFLAWLYADFAGGSGSARRAAAMVSFALAAHVFGRRPDGPRALGLSLMVASIVDPLIAFDLSFLLSAAATAGLMVLQQPLAASLGSGCIRLAALLASCSTRLTALLGRGRLDRAPARPARFITTLAGAVATTLAATIGCAPLIAFLAPTLSVGGVPANLLAVPLGELLALPLCLAHVFLSGFPLVERGDALVASGSLLLVRTIARITEQVGWLAVPVPPPSGWQCALLWCAATAAKWGRPPERLPAVLVAAALLLVCEVKLRQDGVPHGKLRVTVLDIGQGDASIIDLPDGSGLLLDAGGMVGSPIDTGQAVVQPVLRARRRSSLAAVVLSHPHPDHFGGIASAVSRVGVEEFWDNGQGEQEGAGPVYGALVRTMRDRGVAIVRPAVLCAGPRVFGGATIEVLAPCPAPIPFINANDNSFVLRVKLGDRAALLVGDAEKEEEEVLLAQSRGLLRADFLKVGHHGSRTSSSPPFLRAVGAKDVAISCGVRNRFGHPHPITLGNLSGLSRVFRTDRDGSIRWETDGKTSTVTTAGGGVWAFP